MSVSVLCVFSTVANSCMQESSRKGVCVSACTRAPHRTGHIVPASCVSMVTAGVGATSKVWRNLPDNPEGQHTPLSAQNLTPLSVCGCVSLKEARLS